jgi:hypothetical protein
MILHYNHTKRGVDNANKSVREYSCARRISRWPLRFFMNMLVIGALNAFIIWMLKNKDWNQSKPNCRYRFLLELDKELTNPNILRSASNPNGLQLPVVRAIEAAGVYVARNTAAQSTPSTSGQQQSRKRGRCSYCSNSNDRKVNTVCSECRSFICEKHRKTSTTVTCANICSDGNT